MKKFGNILWGLVFILLGLIIGLNALGYTQINLFFRGWWTLFIIIPCFIGIFRDNSKLGNGTRIGNRSCLIIVCTRGVTVLYGSKVNFSIYISDDWTKLFVERYNLS